MFKKIAVFTLLAISFLTGSSLQAHCCRGCGCGWGAFGAGVGVGIIGSEICRPSYCCPPPVYCQPVCGCVVYNDPPPVIVQQPVVQQVVYRNNYDFIGNNVVSQVSATPNARTLTLNNGMVFQIAPGSFNCTGCNVTVYRDASAGPTGNYVLEIRGQQFRANRLAANPIPAPAPAQAPIPAPSPS